MFGTSGKKDKARQGYPTRQEMTGFVGKGVRLEGALAFEGLFRIDGQFKGEITSNGVLVVGEEGRVDANIKADSVIINGEVRGSIEAKKRVELNSPARVIGDIRTPNLVISDGVVFEGSCKMTKKEQGGEEKIRRIEDYAQKGEGNL